MTVLATTTNFSDLKNLEKFFILKYKSLQDEFGYNMSIDCDKGLELYDEASKNRRNISLHSAQANRKKSKYGIGVRLTNKKFYANIRKNGINYNVPASDQRDAMNIYDRLAKYLYGECAVLNSPDSIFSQEELESTFIQAKNILDIQKSSKYRGVSYNVDKHLYFASISKDKVKYNLGTYKYELDAAKMVDIARMALYEKITKQLNFPELIDINNINLYKSQFDALMLSLKDNPEDKIMFEKRIKKYFFKIPIDNNLKTLGYYSDKNEAIMIYDMAVMYFSLPYELICEDRINFYKENYIKIISDILYKIKHKGIIYVESRKTYRVNIKINGKNKYIGTSKTFEEAVALLTNAKKM